jgi:hypothetical protein
MPRARRIRRRSTPVCARASTPGSLETSRPASDHRPRVAGRPEWSSTIRHVDPNQALVITATAAAVSAVAAGLSFLITIALLLETRASRIASRDSATVVARLRFSDDRQDYEELALENLGPAIARDVHLKVEYIDSSGHVVKAADTISVAVMAPSRDDRLVFLPGILMMESEHGKVPDAPELAERGLSLRLGVDWLDDRRWFPFWFAPKRHTDTVVVDLRAYSQAYHHPSIRVVDATLVSEIHATRTMIERESREQVMRNSMESRDPPPDIQVRVEAKRVSQALELWRARFRWWVLRRRGR